MMFLVNSLHVPCGGIGGYTTAEFLRERNDLGVRLQEKVVAVSTYQGSLVMLEADSGCAAQTYEGPHVPISQGVETVQFVDVGNPSSPDMIADEASARRCRPVNVVGLCAANNGR